MLSQSTDTVLRAMKLTGMANELERQNADPKLIAALSFDEHISLIVDAEWRKRQSSKMKRYVNDACLPIKRAQVEDIEYHPDRKLKNPVEIDDLSDVSILFGTHDHIDHIDRDAWKIIGKKHPFFFQCQGPVYLYGQDETFFA